MAGIPRVVAVVIIALTLVLFVAGASISVETRNYPWLSTSPNNPGEGGSYWFYKDLSTRANVILGGPHTLEKTRGARLYLVIGPDKPFTDTEAELIARSVEEGNLTLLVADETSNSRSLLEALGLNVLGETVYNETVHGGGWEWVVKLTCLNQTIYTTKAVRVRETPGSRVICRYGDGTPAAASYKVGNGTVIVVGDSSIFANFLYRGDYKLLPPSRNVVLMIVGEAGLNGLVIFDNTHYNYTPSDRGLYYLTGLAGQVASSIDQLRERAESMSGGTLLFLVLAASAPWALIFLYPSRPPGWGKSRLEEHMEWLLSVEASRVGVEAETQRWSLDVNKVARKVLKVAGSGSEPEGEDTR